MHDRLEDICKNWNWQGSISKIYKELLQMNKKMIGNPIEKRSKVMNRQFTERGAWAGTRIRKDVQRSVSRNNNMPF